MSKINDLIKELCPNGVIYKKYGDVFEIKTGKGITTKEATDDGLYPIISGGTTPMGYYHSYNRDENIVTVSRVGANAGYVNFITEKFYLNDKCFSIIPKDEFVKCFIPKYIYHYTKNIENKIMKLQSEGGVPTINTQKVSNLLMPMLPIDVQLEIINILDKFGELEAELEVELEARKSQYEFWRGKLLDKNDNLKSIGELFEFKNGINKSKDCFGTGNLIINYVDVYKNNKITNEIVKGLVELNDTDLIRYSCKSGDVFFTRTSETREEVGIASVLIDDMNDSVFSGFLLRARPTTDLLIPEYCAYCFSSSRVRKDIISYANFTTRATVTGPILSKVKIYVPSKEEQKRIVNVLDKMYYLINSFIDGIPAEIELRRKQYEYYRNKLLSFEELSFNE